MSNENKSLPFQVQISYTTLTGMKCLRVITKTKEVTRNEEEAQSDIDVAVFGMHSNAKQASYAQQGMLDEAVAHAQEVDQIMLRNVSSDQDRQGYGNYQMGQEAFVSRVKKVQEKQQMLSPQNASLSLNTIRQQQQSIIENDDDDSNMIYAQRNVRKQKKNWSSNRKYYN